MYWSKMNKPFQTTSEQIAILNRRGLSTDSKTADILLREGYYCIINGYKDPFLFPGKQNGEDAFRHGASFNEIYRLFLFDRSLRMLLFKYIAIAEAALKTVTAYKFSQAHQTDHHKYLEGGTYRNDGRYPIFAGYLIEDFETILGMNDKGRRRRPKPYIKHYLDNHEQVPIWVLMNYLSLGQAVKFFDFQKNEIRRSIASTFTDLYCHEHTVSRNIKPKDLSRAFDHIKDMRNICAHDERLYCARVSPRSDTTFADVLDDLSLVLPANKNRDLRAEVATEIINSSSDIRTITVDYLLKEMGIRSVDSLIPSA